MRVWTTILVANTQELSIQRRGFLRFVQSQSIVRLWTGTCQNWFFQGVKDLLFEVLVLLFRTERYMINLTNMTNFKNQSWKTYVSSFLVSTTTALFAPWLSGSKIFDWDIVYPAKTFVYSVLLVILKGSTIQTWSNCRWGSRYSRHFSSSTTPDWTGCRVFLSIAGGFQSILEWVIVIQLE